MFNEYEDDQFVAATKELGSADEVRKLVEASERMQGDQLVTPFYQPSIDPDDQNIVFSTAKVISGYNQETFSPQIASSNESRLLAFSQRTNSEIAIGYVRNSVYNSIANGDPQFTTTYFPIGDPPIMVTVNTNNEDPFGDFWKCKHGPTGAGLIFASDDRAPIEGAMEAPPDGSIDFPDDYEPSSSDDDAEIENDKKNVIITTTDGVKYCMPYTQCKLVHSTRTEKMNRWAQEQHDGRMGFTKANKYYDPLTKEIVLSTKGTVAARILPFKDQLYRVRQRQSVQSFDVPIPSSLIDSMTYDPATPLDPYGTSPGNFLSLFKEENLRANYKAAQLPRENEYKVTYNVVEGESLQSRFGQDYDLSTTLNNIYIGLATFLATTFIEVAYTFKKVDAQKLTPEQVTPANLAFAAGTNVINAVAGMGIEQITTAGYYPSDYLDSYGTEAYRVPEPPAGGFYDYDYYTRMADMVLEPTEDGGDMTDASALADDLGSMY